MDKAVLHHQKTYCSIIFEFHTCNGQVDLFSGQGIGEEVVDCEVVRKVSIWVPPYKIKCNKSTIT